MCQLKMLSTAKFFCNSYLCSRMAEIAIMIEEEVEEFIRNERPLWPQVATPCPVTANDKERHSCSFHDFMDQWKQFHTETDMVYKCKVCRRSYGTNKHKKVHTNSKFETINQMRNSWTRKVSCATRLDPLPFEKR